MTIAWNVFTPWSALIGGMLIGLAAAMFALLNGRVAGISGVLGGLLKPMRGDVGWRVAFIGGLVVAPLVYGLFATLPAVQIDASYVALIVAGLAMPETMRPTPKTRPASNDVKINMKTP